MNTEEFIIQAQNSNAVIKRFITNLLSAFFAALIAELIFYWLVRSNKTALRWGNDHKIIIAVCILAAIAGMVVWLFLFRSEHIKRRAMIAFLQKKLEQAHADILKAAQIYLQREQTVNAEIYLADVRCEIKRLAYIGFAIDRLKDKTFKIS